MSASKEDYLKKVSTYINKMDSFFTSFCENVDLSVEENLRHELIGKKEKVMTKSDESHFKKFQNKYSFEPLLPDYSSQNVSDPRTTLLIDKEKQEEILQYYGFTNNDKNRQVPQSSGEWVANFSREERLALHDYALKNAANVAKPPELYVNIEDEDKNCVKKELTEFEIRKKLRDMKRRKPAHRISTKNKTHTMVTRELISNMMSALGLTPEDHEDDHQSTSKHSEEKSSNFDEMKNRIKEGYNRDRDSKRRRSEQSECHDRERKSTEDDMEKRRKSDKKSEDCSEKSQRHKHKSKSHKKKDKYKSPKKHKH